MDLDEQFWTEHTDWTAADLFRRYPHRFQNDANWRRAKRDARKKFPWLWPDEPDPFEYVVRAENRHHKVYLDPVTDLMLGFCGDTHGGSAEEKLEELHTFYDICEREGVEHVLHTGDVTAGDNVYKGQRFDLRLHGYDDQSKHVEREYPHRKGITTHVLAGNHDHSFHRIAGANIVKSICENREDMRYLGLYGATVELSPGFTIYVHHLNGGIPYARSYRRQKVVEGFTGGTKPRIYIAGHDHQAMWFNYRNVEVFGTGCFEGQTDLLRRMGVDPVVGGYIVEVKLDENGAIRRIRPEFVKFYEKY